MSLLTVLVEKLPSWPKGTDSAVSSPYGNAVFFYRPEGEYDYDGYEVMYEIPGATGPYECVTRQEWLGGRANPDVAEHLLDIRRIASKRLSLENKVEGAKDDLLYAQAQLVAFEEDPHNFKYLSEEEAHDLENILYEKAYQACEVAYSCGEAIYSRKCFIDGVLHEAMLYVDYYQYSEEYYSIRDYTFEIVKV